MNISVLRLRPDRVDHEHFTAPTALPVLGVITCLALITQTEADVFLRAGILLFVGLVLWGANRVVMGKTANL